MSDGTGETEESPVRSFSKKRIVRAAVVVAAVIAIIAAVWFGFRFAMGTDTPFFVVSSGSMIPTLNIGDAIVVQDGGDFQDLLPQKDIIVFNRPVYHDRVIVHRAIQVLQNDGETVVRTKGDNNKLSDPWVVKQEDYVGKVIFVIPFIGNIASLLSPPVNYVLIAVVIVLMFLSELHSSKKPDKKTANTGEN